VKRFVEEAEQKATELLKGNLDKLHKLAKALLDKEILDGNEIDRIIGSSDNQSESVPEAAPQTDR
jgi:cell division protease FtsH